MAIIVPIVSAFDSKGLDKAIREIQRAKGGFDKFVAGTAAIGESFKKTGQSLTRNITGPLAVAGGAAAKLSIDFDSSMTKIVSLVGIAATEVDGMRQSVLKLSGETGKGPKELADGLFVLTSAGLRGNDALSALEQSAKASASGLGETNDIARAVAGAMSAYGSDVVDAARATDVITATARAGNFEVSQFSGALGRVLPFAQQAGASLEDVGGAVALLTRTNGDAAQSVTQIQALLRAFVVPSMEAQKALSNVGLSAGDLRAAISTDGLPAALEMLDKKLGGNREQLGRVLGSSEAASAAFQILEADAESIAGTFGSTARAAGATNDAFNITAETAGFKMQKSLNELKIVAIELGDTLVPFVEKFSDAIGRATESFKNMSPRQQDLLVKFGALLAIMGPLIILLGTFLTSMSKIVAILGATSAALGFNATMFKKNTIAAGEATVAVTIFGRAARVAMAGTGIGLLIVLAAELIMKMTGLGNETTKTADKSVEAGARMRNSFAGMQDEIDATREKNAALARELALGKQESRDAARSRGRNQAPVTSLDNLFGDIDLPTYNSSASTKSDKAAAKMAAEVAKQTKAVTAALDKMNGKLTTAREKLKAAQEAYANFKNGISDSIKGILNFGDIAKEESGTFLENLRKQANGVVEFSTKVKKLIAMGLSETGIQQVLAAGAQAGGKIADELIAGGAAAISETNELLSTVQSAAEMLGKAGADEFYQAGITQGEAMVNGIVAAIKNAGFAMSGGNAVLPKKLQAALSSGKLTAGQSTELTNLVARSKDVNTKSDMILNITVNAGMGADGQVIGREIVDAIKRYERVSGPVFASA